MISIQTFNNEEDTPKIVELILNIQQQEFQIPIGITDQPDLLEIKNFYQQNAGNFWLAKMDNKLIGTIALIDCGEKTGTIRKMFVRKDFRGKEWGTAQLLLETLQQHALENGIEKLFLGTVERLQAAMRFYEKNGFARIPKENLPQVFPLMQLDTHFYQKVL